jgi:hypothetical protein
MRTLKPWAYGPFEILLHAEMHYRVGEDFDRRIAMVGFDNAIEVAVTTYLTLHPIQRGNRTYTNADVARWLGNFHSKIEFLLVECTSRTVTLISKQDEIIWFHEVRNGQYHVGGATVPQNRELDGVRLAAIEIIGLLFELPDLEAILEEHIAAQTPPAPPPRNAEHDRLIDRRFGMVEVCEMEMYASEALHAIDPILYREIAIGLAASKGATEDIDSQ